MKKLQKWEILSEIDVSPSHWYPLFQHKVKLANGTIIDDYFISRRKDIAMVIPITSDQHVIMVRQYKHGIGQVVIEFPAGRIEPGQTPEQAARLELCQETGALAKELFSLGQIYPSPSQDSAKLYAYVADHIDTFQKQELDKSEDIEVITVPLYKVDTMLEKGEIICSDTLALWTLYKLKYNKVLLQKEA